MTPSGRGIIKGKKRGRDIFVVRDEVLMNWR